MFPRLFLKLEREGMLSDSLYEAGIAQIPMPDKRTTKSLETHINEHTYNYSQRNTGKTDL